MSSTTRTRPDGGLPLFLSTALRRPKIVGAVAPTSRSLSTTLAAVVPRHGPPPTVLELGAGTGAVSAAIARRLPAGGTHIAVEIDPDLAGHLRRRWPGMRVLCGDAADLSTLLTELGPGARMDAVVSGLPWSLFEPARQRRILGEVCRVLAPGGGFSTMAYWTAAPFPAARRFRALLDEYFDEVVLTRTAWRNLPPAWTYLCRRPNPNLDHA